jgi:hypothetical protein
MTRDELISRIVAASSPKPVKVEVPGIGEVYRRVMTAYDADAMRKQMEKLPQDDGCHVGRTLAFVLCDEDGAPLFDPTNAEDVLMLSKLPAGASQVVLRSANEAAAPKD